MDARLPTRQNRAIFHHGTMENLLHLWRGSAYFLARIGQGSAGVGSVSRRPLARISFSKTKDQVLLGACPLEQLNETVRNNLNGITRYHLWERRGIAKGSGVG